ncbi:MAG: iron ABC transporter permease [Firmicutes bacterium]|nr:iron ABC transporter permease [Bacillota bacterium]
MRSRLKVIRLRGISFRANLWVLTLVCASLAVALLLSAWALTLGSFSLPIREVVRALIGSGSDQARFIVMDLRLPRIMAAVLIGAMLSMSGAIFQGVVRNPLVAPDMIGINAGASLSAVIWIVGEHPSELLPIAAFAGALMAAGAIYLLTWRGNIAGARLILVGIGVNAMLGAATTILLVRSEIHDASRIVLWMTGSVYGSDWNDVRVLAFALAVLAPVGVVLMWYLRVLQLGDLTAGSLGMPVERVRLALIIVGCGLSGVAVSIAGPIGFVALMVPHVARMLAGPMTSGVFVLTALLGSILLLGSDMIGQHALPVGLPAGVITAALGAPYFLFLLYRTQTRV